jgi:hypothetical protein
MYDYQIHVEMVFIFLDEGGTAENNKYQQKYLSFNLPDGRNPQYFPDHNTLGYDEGRTKKA